MPCLKTIPPPRSPYCTLLFKGNFLNRNWTSKHSLISSFAHVTPHAKSARYIIYHHENIVCNEAAVSLKYLWKGN
jgi:hypothetical protein